MRNPNCELNTKCDINIMFARGVKVFVVYEMGEPVVNDAVLDNWANPTRQALCCNTYRRPYSSLCALSSQLLARCFYYLRYTLYSVIFSKEVRVVWGVYLLLNWLPEEQFDLSSAVSQGILTGFWDQDSAELCGLCLIVSRPRRRCKGNNL